MYFENITEAPPDSILGLNIRFAKETRKNKVNLGAGVYKTSELKPFILKTVKQAETLLVETETSKDYLPIDGLPDYISKARELVFGKNALSIYGAQTVGGTGALSIGARFLKEIGLHTLYLSQPTWANHNLIFQQAGLKIETYPYFNWSKKDFDFTEFMETLTQMPERSIVLLQLCCHNPMGVDPTYEQWLEISKTMKKRELFPFFDFAYQGFGENLEKDREPLIPFLNQGLECMVALSNAKNFGLYAERCGALFFVCHSEQTAKKIGSRIKVIIRSIYSNPPCHGARIVATILQNEILKSTWEKELAHMRERIIHMRASLLDGLQKKTEDFNFLKKQRGMFIYTGLNEKQVEKLIADYGIYLPKDGRMNAAGLNEKNLQYVIDAILNVI